MKSFLEMNINLICWWYPQFLDVFRKKCLFFSNVNEEFGVNCVDIFYLPQINITYQKLINT